MNNIKEGEGEDQRKNSILTWEIFTIGYKNNGTIITWNKPELNSGEKK